MIDLTKDEKMLLLFIGDEADDDQFVSGDKLAALPRLIQKGLVEKRPDSLDLTDEGWDVYESLGGTNV